MVVGIFERIRGAIAKVSVVLFSIRDGAWIRDRSSVIPIYSMPSRVVRPYLDELTEVTRSIALATLPLIISDRETAFDRERDSIERVSQSAFDLAFPQNSREPTSYRYLGKSR
jgi:hypothetical protein